MSSKAYVLELQGQLVALIPADEKEATYLQDGHKPNDTYLGQNHLLIRNVPKDIQLKEFDYIVGNVGIEHKTNLCCFLFEQKFEETTKDNKIMEDYISALLPAGFSVSRISADEYRKLYSLAQKANKVSSIIANGFAINRKYVVYGKKADDEGKVLIAPFYIRKK